MKKIALLLAFAGFLSGLKAEQQPLYGSLYNIDPGFTIHTEPQPLVTAVPMPIITVGNEFYDPMPNVDVVQDFTVKTADETVHLIRIISTDTNQQQPVVRAVHDGDSYKIQSVITEWVRIEGVDCPEVISNHVSADQPFGRAIGDSVRQLIKGREVKMVTFGKDRYGRTLVTIEIQGRDLGEILLEKGWGVYIRNDLPLKQRRKYQRLRDYAKKKKLGIWSDPTMMTPEKWRSIYRRQ